MVVRSRVEERVEGQAEGLSDEQADRVFQALADATRRDIVARTLQVEQSVSGLARNYPMSFAAVQKHVAVLERAGLVSKHRCGREQRVRAERGTIRRAAHLLDHLEELWRARVDGMHQLLAEDDDPEHDAPDDDSPSPRTDPSPPRERPDP